MFFIPYVPHGCAASSVLALLSQPVGLLSGADMMGAGVFSFSLLGALSGSSDRERLCCLTIGLPEWAWMREQLAKACLKVSYYSSGPHTVPNLQTLLVSNWQGVSCLLLFSCNAAV
jgi:hypothetical protein